MSPRVVPRGRCECCGVPISVMCQDRFCGGRCETGKCGHRDRVTIDETPVLRTYDNQSNNHHRREL